MPTLRVSYLDDDGKEYELNIVPRAGQTSPVQDGELTIQGVVAIVDSVITGIVR